jgi:RHS repeat-associated protein
VLAEVDGSGTLRQFYSGGASLVKAHIPSAGAVDQYQHLDEQGTVVIQSDSTGAALIGVVDPNPWGGYNTVNPFGWIGQPGYWYENGLRRPLYYVRARWYQTGGPGWLSPDPQRFGGGDWNLYRYVGNRPTVGVDPTGTDGQGPIYVPFPPSSPASVLSCATRSNDYCAAASKDGFKNRAANCFCYVSSALCKLVIFPPAPYSIYHDRINCLNRCMYNHWKKRDTPMWQKAGRICATCGPASQQCCRAMIAAEQNGLTQCLNSECGPDLGPLPPKVKGFPFQADEPTRTRAAQGLCCYGRYGNDPRNNPIIGG